jgi:hypothetical protein
MNPAAKCLILFLSGFVVCPALMILHELRHYAAGSCLGFKATLHYGATTWSAAEEKSMPQTAVLAVSAGPLGDAVLAGVGLLWLYRLRGHRREAAPTLVDWLATILAVQAGRWLRGFTGPPSSPQPPDEAFISQALGMPAWLLPYLFALLCLIPLGAMVRLHPPGARLLPFTCLIVGACAGGLVWLTFLGRFLLP